MRILVADKSWIARLVLRKLLAGLGHKQVAEVADGREALRRVERGGVELLFADQDLPGLDGMGLIEQLRHSIARQVAVLILLPGAQPGAEARAVRAGAVGCLHKPFRLHQLREGLQEARAERRAHEMSSGNTTLRGHLNEVGFPELVQFLAACRMNGKLTIRSAGACGTLDLRAGEIRSASCGSLFGDAAVFAIADFDCGSFRFEQQEGPLQTNVSMRTMPLLLESMRQRDEKTACQ